MCTQCPKAVDLDERENARSCQHCFLMTQVDEFKDDGLGAAQASHSVRRRQGLRPSTDLIAHVLTAGLKTAADSPTPTPVPPQV